MCCKHPNQDNNGIVTDSQGKVVTDSSFELTPIREAAVDARSLISENYRQQPPDSVFCI
jgi:hypothetical protein